MKQLLRSLASRLSRRRADSVPVLRTGGGNVPAVARDFEWMWAPSPDFDYDLAAYAFREWVSTAIDRVAELCVSVPIEIRSADGMTLYPDHPLLGLIGPYGRPNPLQDSLEFMESHFQRVDVFGNDIWYWVSKAGGAPDAVYQLDPRKVAISNKGGAVAYEYRNNGVVYKLASDQITHFRRSNMVESGLYWGISAIQKLRNVVESDLRMTRWNQQFFETGTPSGILVVDYDAVSADEAKNIEYDFQSRADAKRRMAVIRARPGSAVFHPANLAHRDMEFRVGRLLTRQAAFDALGFHVGAVSEASTEAHARVAERMVRTSAHIRHMRSASRMNEVLGFWPGSEGKQIRFQDVRTVDWEHESRKLAAVAPYMTVNEVRSRYLDLPSLPGLDYISDGPDIKSGTPSGDGGDSDEQGRS